MNEHAKVGSGKTIAVIGVGGTGSALLPLLGTMPISSVTVVDGDTVAAVNLIRQPLYDPEAVGSLKAQVAAERMRGRAVGIQWRTEARFIDHGNCVELLAAHDLVADCTDDLAVRTLVEKHCRALGIPLVSGAVHGHQLQVITCMGTDHRRPGKGFFQGHASEDQMGCDMRSVPAAVTTMAAALMALRIEALLQGDDTLVGVMDLVDCAHGRWMRIMGPEAGEFLDTPVQPGHHA